MKHNTTVEGSSFDSFSGSGLFSVTPGISLSKALQTADTLLSTIDDMIADAADEDRPILAAQGYAMLHVLSSARAVIRSGIDSLGDQQA